MSLYTVKKTGPGHYSIVKQEEIGWTNNIEQAELIAKVMNAYSEDAAEKPEGRARMMQNDAIIASSADLIRAWENAR